MQKNNHHFLFHHRYLNKPNEIAFNELGLRDVQSYTKVKAAGVFRVAFFGGTTSAGWEMRAEESQAARLREHLQAQMPDRKFEVMNASVRLYATGQLYKFYREEIAAYQPDLVLYYFNLNHPRRTISAHESGKSPLLSQPIYQISENGAVKELPVEPAKHPNDMIYLENDGTIARIEGKTDTSLHRWLRDRSHLYTLFDDIKQGPVRLRNLKDRKEIKDIELREKKSRLTQDFAGLPYQWQIVADLLRRWSEEVIAAGGKFVVAPHLAYYNVRNGALNKDTPQHPWGFTFETIPERYYLSHISGRLNFPYLDTYALARQYEFDADDFFVHPRYGYVNAEGAEFISKLLCNEILANDLLGKPLAN